MSDVMTKQMQAMYALLADPKDPKARALVQKLAADAAERKKARPKPKKVTVAQLLKRHRKKR